MTLCSKGSKRPTTRRLAFGEMKKARQKMDTETNFRCKFGRLEGSMALGAVWEKEKLFLTKGKASKSTHTKTDACSTKIQPL
jgi:hypothetical protein